MILRRFGRQAHADGARDKLPGFRRRDRESLGAFATDICRYTCLGYPTFDTRAQEALALHAFTPGLQLEQLREHLHLYGSRTLTDATVEGEQVEHVLNTGIIPYP